MPAQVPFDLLVAADGVNSSVRHSLESGLPRFKGKQPYLVLVGLI